MVDWCFKSYKRGKGKSKKYIIIYNCDAKEIRSTGWGKIFNLEVIIKGSRVKAR